MLIDYLHKESLDVKKRNLIVLPDIVVLLLLLVIVCLFHLNTTLFWNINRVSEYTGSFLWANLTILGDALVAAVVIFPFIRKKPQLVWTALMAAVVAALLVHTLKPLLDVARPADVLDNDLMNKIGPVLHRRAFPSGHTATIFTLIGVFVMYVKTRGQRVGLYLVALLAGISRIAVGVHWPADVLAGAAVGLLGAFCGYWLVAMLDWGENRTAQLIWGGIFIVAALVLLTVYDTYYDQAIWFQRSIAVVVLILGGRDFFRLIRDGSVL